MPIFTDQTPIAFADPLPEATEVVVIGAGIAGTATAYFLARQGVKVLLCDKGRVAGEQSSRNWGWVRQQGRDWAELPIMMEANRIWRGLAAETGEADLAFTPSGCVYLSDDADSLKKYEGWHAMARQHQLDTRMLSRAEVEARFPGVAGAWTGGMVTESDGRAEPFVAVPALARAAQRAGAAVIEACAVRTLEVENGRVTGVVTEKGRVRCERVLLSGGAWSTHFAANAGVDLPQLAVRSTVARTEPVPEVFSANLSLPGLAIRRREDGGYSVSSGDLAEHYLSPKSFRYFGKFLKLLKLSAKDVRVRLRAPEGYPGAWGAPSRWSGDEVSPFECMRVLNPAPSPIVVKRIEERLPLRVPELKGVKLAEAWAGMIDVTPDAVPTLGEDERLKGLFIATGLSGHGFGIGPAIGRIMADLLRDRPAGHDPRALSRAALLRRQPDRAGALLTRGPFPGAHSPGPFRKGPSEEVHSKGPCISPAPGPSMVHRYWPDDWAASHRAVRLRPLQTLFPKSMNRDAGRDSSCAGSPLCRPSTKGNLHDCGHRKVLQRPKRLRLHSAGRWPEGRLRPCHRAGARRHQRPEGRSESDLRHAE